MSFGDNSLALHEGLFHMMVLYYLDKKKWSDPGKGLKMGAGVGEQINAYELHLRI